MKSLKAKVERAFELTLDMANHLEEEHLTLKMETLPSNRIGEQFWCVIGARESYIKAVEASGWQGFTCSLKDTKNKEEILACLVKTQLDMKALLEKELSEQQWDILLDLHEHEIQHHGQLIRYVYGNRLSFPISWTNRYTVK